MCCIFTWLAWCFDASHRVVVFIMACLISSSICCLLLIASMAGVAMGYNYSLAEYIDLKETNISVYIKRGVYDDEIADDFDWRRSGKDLDVVTVNNPVLKDEQPLAARRRLKDSAFEADDENKYEGSLLRLTSPHSARPLYQPEPPYTTSPKTTNRVDRMLAIADNLPAGSVERLRAIQAAAKVHEDSKVELAKARFPDDASARMKAIEANAQIHDSRRHELTTTTDKYAKYFNQLSRYPPMPGSDLAARRFQDQQEKDTDIASPDRFREVVFKGHLAGMRTGPTTTRTTVNFFEYDTGHGREETSKPQSAEEPKPRNDGSQSIEYEDSRGFPSRKKRCNDKLEINKKLNETTDDNSYTIVKYSKYPSNMVLDKVKTHETVKIDSINSVHGRETKIDNKTNSDNDTQTLDVKVCEEKNSDHGRETKIDNKTNSNNDTQTLDVKICEEKNSDHGRETKIDNKTNSDNDTQTLDVKVCEEKNSDHGRETKIDNKTNSNNDAQTLNVKVCEDKNTQDVNINKASTEVSPKTVDRSTLIEKMKNTKFEDSHKKVSINELIKNYFNYLTNGQTENKENTIRKRRRKFEGYEYKSVEGKDVKTIWWRISNGIHEIRNKIVNFVDRRIFSV